MSTQKPSTLPDDQLSSRPESASRGWHPMAESTAQPAPPPAATHNARPTTIPERPAPPFTAIAVEQRSGSGPTRSGRYMLAAAIFGIATAVFGFTFVVAFLNRQLSSALLFYLVITALCGAGLRWSLLARRASGQIGGEVRKLQGRSGVRRRRSGRIVGEARNFMERSELKGTGMWTVWSFRVESYDASGNRLPPIPVEMRGLKFTGAISEGDWVEVQGRWREGRTLRAKRVYNQTTKTTVAAVGTPLWSKLLSLIFLALFILLFVSFCMAAGIFM